MMTKNFYLIGKDIAHSLSPVIHSEIYAFLGVDARYGLMPLDDISKFKGLDFGKISGFNVTAPYKTAILDYVDRDFSGSNSVNTLKICNDTNVASGIDSDGSNNCNFCIEGYSTDGKGFILDAKRLSLGLERVLILGNGGAAKSIIHELSKLNGEVFVLSKDKDAAQAQAFKPTLTVNCTGSDAPFGLRFGGKTCYDLRYTNCSADVYNGLGMLIYQAILSDEIFFDTRIELSVFERIYKKLNQKL